MLDADSVVKAPVPGVTLPIGPGAAIRAVMPVPEITPPLEMVMASVAPELTTKLMAFAPYVPITRFVDPEARYTAPAAFSEPVPTNVDEFIPNSPKLVVAVAALFETFRLIDADVLLLVF